MAFANELTLCYHFSQFSAESKNKWKSSIKLFKASVKPIFERMNNAPSKYCTKFGCQSCAKTVSETTLIFRLGLGLYQLMVPNDDEDANRKNATITKAFET
jgi:hypothetical protein